MVGSNNKRFRSSEPEESSGYMWMSPPNKGPGTNMSIHAHHYHPREASFNTKMRQWLFWLPVPGHLNPVAWIQWNPSDIWNLTRQSRLLLSWSAHSSSNFPILVLTTGRSGASRRSAMGTCSIISQAVLVSYTLVASDTPLRHGWWAWKFTVTKLGRGCCAVKYSTETSFEEHFSFRILELHVSV